MIANKIKVEKQFDSVKLMRQIRDEISLETQNMNFKDLKLYINNHLSDKTVKNSIDKSLSNN
ncbi:MAG: hypothetical protein NTW25_14005 [Candidatus Kapabacteria bacterium]|nr:hypothetical protein [Candidatus Kapabacteria bacterium]